eukprot:9894622-Prorocentrum_lima.AAC.1
MSTVRYHRKGIDSLPSNIGKWICIRQGWSTTIRTKSRSPSKTVGTCCRDPQAMVKKMARGPWRRKW